MKRSPAQTNADNPTNPASWPQGPGMSKKMNAAKCRAIMIQPVSQIPETGVGFRRDTEANAAVSKPMAARSGISLQLITITSKMRFGSSIESTNLVAAPSPFGSSYLIPGVNQWKTTINPRSLRGLWGLSLVGFMRGIHLNKATKPDSDYRNG